MTQPVFGRFRFDQDDMNLVFGHWQLIDTTGNDHDFSGADSNPGVAQFDEQRLIITKNSTSDSSQWLMLATSVSPTGRAGVQI